MRKKFILSLQLIVSLFLVISSSFGEEDKIIISSFEKEDELKKWTTQYQAKIEQSKEHATEGEYSVKVTFPTEGYPGIFIHPGEEDWSKYVYFCVERYSPQPETTGVSTSFTDSSGREIIRYDFGNIVGENINYGKIYIPSLKKDNPDFDMTKVQKISFVMGPRDKEQIFYLDNVRLEGHSKDIFKPPLISDFEGQEELYKLGNNISVRLEISSEYASSGDYSLKATFLSEYEWPNLTFYLANGMKARDWSDYQYLAFEVFNPNEEEFPFSLTVKSAEQSDFKSSQPHYANIKGRQEETVKISISELASKINIENVAEFGISIRKHEKATTIYIDNIRLVLIGEK